MTYTSFDRVAPVEALDRLPIRLDQSTSHSSILLWLVLLVPAFAAIAIPLMLVAAHAVAEPATLTMLSEHPVTTIQIGVGVALWCALFVRPLQRVLTRAGLARVIEMTPATVQVTDSGLLRSQSWSEPLAAFHGIAHHVRASLSGVRHELVLVHPDPRRHVLLVAAPAMTQTAILRVSALLGLPEVPARELYVPDTTRATASPSEAPVPAAKAGETPAPAVAA
jgi:hypothetical protein